MKPAVVAVVAVIVSTVARAAPPVAPASPAAIFPDKLSVDGAQLYALCVVATLPTPYTGTGHRDVGALIDKTAPQDVYPVIVFFDQTTAEGLGAYSGIEPMLQVGVLDYDTVCPRDTPKMRAHTVITGVVENLEAKNPPGKRTFLVLGGTVAALKKATVIGTDDDARKAAIRLAREVTGAALVTKIAADGRYQVADKWGEAFGTR